MRRFFKSLTFLLVVLLSSACSKVYSQNPGEAPTQSQLSYVQELQGGFGDVAQIALFYCLKIYPQPTPAECLDRIKHGIGNSFDPHSAYLNGKEVAAFRDEMSGAGFAGIGIEIAKPGLNAPVMVMSAIEGTPGYRAGLLSGDLIMAVSENGRDFVSLLNMNTDNAVKKLRGAVGTTATLKVRRQGVEKELVIPVRRDTVRVAQIKGELLHADGKTYILLQDKIYKEGNTRDLKAKYDMLFREAGGDVFGVILSMENNPGGSLAEVIGGVDLFLDAPSIVLERNNAEIKPFSLDPRVFRSSTSPLAVNDDRVPLTQGDITNGLPMLVVVNGGCASACEVFAGNMKFHHRALIASTSDSTFGKGIVQTVTGGPGGNDAIKYTSSEYLIGDLTNWIPVQCIGVKPDIVFSYPGIVEQKRISECDLSEHVLSKGPMENAPPFIPFAEANPAQYRAGQKMLEVYKAHMLPKLQQEEARRKQLQEMQTQ